MNSGSNGRCTHGRNTAARTCAPAGRLRRPDRQRHAERHRRLLARCSARGGTGPDPRAGPPHGAEPAPGYAAAASRRVPPGAARAGVAQPARAPPFQGGGVGSRPAARSTASPPSATQATKIPRAAPIKIPKLHDQSPVDHAFLGILRIPAGHRPKTPRRSCNFGDHQNCMINGGRMMCGGAAQGRCCAELPIC